MLAVLRATRATQGKRDNDFAWTDDDELVGIGYTCDSAVDDPDGVCGCGRSFSGFDTRRATTTAVVGIYFGSVEDYRAAYRASQERAGWLDDGEWDDEADEMLRIAAEYHFGTVLERRLDEITNRRHEP